MAVFDRFRHRLRSLARSEEGMALPFALFATIATMALAGAAVVSSVNVQQGAHRDSGAKNAIAAADAGAGVALLRANRYASALSTAPTSNCLGSTGSQLVVTGAAADGWCPPVEGTVGGSSYSYRVTPMGAAATPVLVATGYAGGVSRRIEIALNETSVSNLLNGVGVLAQDDIKLYNSAEIETGVGTNGSLYLYNSATICGDIRHGVGEKVEYVNSAGQCKSYVVTEGEETLPQVADFMPTDIASNNSNFRLEKCNPWLSGNDSPPGCELDTYTSNNKNTWGWIPGTVTHPGSIELSNSSTLTLGGGDYFLCRLVINNSSVLYMAAGAHVRIFFDTPEHCGLRSGASQLELNNSSNIVATGYEKNGEYAVPGLYVQGSVSQSTSIKFNNSSGSNEFDLYAPNSSIELNNSATFKGTIVGERVTMANSARVKQDAGYQPPDIGGATIYARQSYIECSGDAVSTPDENC